MKNKKKIFFFYLFFLIIYLEKASSEQFNFEAKEIKILEAGNVLSGKDGVKITSDNNIEIDADSFLYNKNTSILLINGNVEIYDRQNNVKISGEEFIYKKDIEKIFSKKKIQATLESKYNLNTKDLTYLVNEKEIVSKEKTTLTDNLNNLLETDNFTYSVINKIFKSNNFVYTDNTGNKSTINKAILNTKNNQIIGKDLEIDFNKDTFGNNNNDPRLKGRAIFINKNETKVNKGIFTTCKKNDKCPPWSMSADEIIHDKLKKTINYKNAVLKVYDKPIFYFPKFFHPDPTVKRQTGFLMPSIADNNNLGTHVSIPYFKVLSDSKDLTFKPRLYSDNSALINTEYRTITKNSKHIIDTSIKNKGSKKNSNNTKTHFFSNSKINLNNSLFETSDVEINLEQVSNNNYLKAYNINSSIVNNTSVLNSFITLSGFNDDLFFQGNIETYEDTSKEDSDKYQYIFPNIKIDKIFDLGIETKGQLSLNTNGFIKEYDTNIKEKQIINNLNYKSFATPNPNGFFNNYSFILKNINSDTENPNNNNLNNSKLDILSAGMFTSSYPLKKINKNFTRFLTPKISFRYSPNNTKNIADSDTRINNDNVFSFNRIGNNDTIETGASMTIGSEYLINNSSNDNIFKLDLATVFNHKENADLPTKSTLGNKSSNIFGNVEMKPSKYFNIKYNFSLDNDFNKSKYDLIKAEFSINNFVNSFEFLEETDELGNQGYWSNKTTLNLGDSNSLSFDKRRNTKTNLNEYYNLIYQYRNDCLTAAIEYNKNFYNDGDLKPGEELFFSITIVPFSKINTTNLNR